MKYDDASWHYGGQGFSPDYPQENGATHIGMFLGWALTRGHAGDDLKDDPAVQSDMDKVAQRKMSPRDFLIQYCDERLLDEDLSDAVNPFAAEYYEETGSYFSDYADVFEEYESIYAVEDTWDNFDKIAPLIDKRFEQWTSKNVKSRGFFSRWSKS